MVIVIVAIGLGGLYYSFNQQLFKQKRELSDQVVDLKTKVTDLEKNATEVNKSIKAQTSTTPTSTESIATPASSGQTATKTPTSGSQASQTAQTDSKDWKTFSSAKYNYSVKYPNDWEYKDITSGNSMNAVGFRPKNLKEDTLFNVAIEKSNLDYSIALVKKELGGNSTYKSKTASTLNGQEFTVLNFESKTDSKVKPAVYLLAKDDLVYRFTAGTSSDSAINSTVATMINTFQLAK
jgi:hypothetical protein